MNPVEKEKWKQLARKLYKTLPPDKRTEETLERHKKLVHIALNDCFDNVSNQLHFSG